MGGTVLDLSIYQRSAGSVGLRAVGPQCIDQPLVQNNYKERK